MPPLLVASWIGFVRVFRSGCVCFSSLYGGLWSGVRASFDDLRGGGFIWLLFRFRRLVSVEFVIGVLSPCFVHMFPAAYLWGFSWFQILSTALLVRRGLFSRRCGRKQLIGHNCYS
jgi:hypothetical protein